MSDSENLFVVLFVDFSEARKESNYENEIADSGGPLVFFATPYCTLNT